MTERKYISKIRKGDNLIYLKDEEARGELLTKASNEDLDAMALIPVDVSAMTPSSTFVKNSVIGINGVFYKAKRATSNLPFDLVSQGDAFVTQYVGGVELFIIADSTLNGDWMPWSDSSLQGHINDLDLRMSAIESINWNGRITALEGDRADIYSKLGLHSSQLVALQAATQSVTYNGHTYTLQQIMAQMAKLMEEVVVIQTPQS